MFQVCVCVCETGCLCKYAHSASNNTLLLLLLLHFLSTHYNHTIHKKNVIHCVKTAYEWEIWNSLSITVYIFSQNTRRCVEKPFLSPHKDIFHNFRDATTTLKKMHIIFRFLSSSIQKRDIFLFEPKICITIYNRSLTQS